MSGDGGVVEGVCSGVDEHTDTGLTAEVLVPVVGTGESLVEPLLDSAGIVDGWSLVMVEDARWWFEARVVLDTEATDGVEG